MVNNRASTQFFSHYFLICQSYFLPGFCSLHSTFSPNFPVFQNFRNFRQNANFPTTSNQLLLTFFYKSNFSQSFHNFLKIKVVKLVEKSRENSINTQKSNGMFSSQISFFSNFSQRFDNFLIIITVKFHENSVK